ncbi:sam dependent methyltransferase [Podospora appendiculata]|uniref:Sam dependent methyltransferase n=1 Tax=Podospora appendiculata TaxID=314037 RepID=A0AAE0XHH9_9PEZI|nr:sam dependent methyltransferase [Podospora appendiculata]
MVSNDYTLPSHLDGDGARLNLQHETFRLILDDKFLHAQLPSDFSGRVLDIGTGTGIWAAEFASMYPASDVVGVDLYEPALSPAPSNLRFRVVDVEKSWDLPENAFDLIHGRMFLFLLKSPQTVLKRCFSSLKPGGVVEFQEMQHPYQTDEAEVTPTLRFSRLRVEAAAKCGFDRSIVGSLDETLREAGFADVKISTFRFPIGPWMDEKRMKLVGEKYLQCLRWGMVGLSKVVLIKGLGWTEEQVVKACEEVVADLGKGKVYAPIRVAVARKGASEKV